MFTSARMELLAWFLQMQTPGRGGGCGSEKSCPCMVHIYVGGTRQYSLMYTLEHKTQSSPYNYQENENLFGSRG